MKTNLLIIITYLAIGVMSSDANSQNLLWAKQMGGTSYDSGEAVTVDEGGNVYTTGGFQSTADFDPGAGVFYLTCAGGEDIFVSKLDANGSFLWAKRMGGTSPTGGDNGNAIVVDNSGNVYTTGHFYTTADFDPGVGIYNLTAAGNYDVFISKLDSSGNFVWAKQFGGTIQEEGFSIAVDDSGNVYTAGFFRGTTDFDPGPAIYYLTALSSNSNSFVSKLDSSGNFVWAKQISGTSNGTTSISIDANGNVFTTGNFSSTCDFDPGPGTYNLTSVGGGDMYVSKLSSSGNFIWTKQISGAMDETALSVALDENGSICLTGVFSGTTDFDPGTGIHTLTSAGGIDIFVCKLDTSGNLLWAEQMGGTNDDLSNTIAVDANGNIYTTGNFTGTADFDPGTGTYNLTSAGGIRDIFISRLNASGSFEWAKQFGGTGYDKGISITADSIGNIYATGFFEDTVDFDPGPVTNYIISTGNWDIYVVKMDGVIATGITEENKSFNGINIFPNPATDYFTIDLGSINKKVELSITDIDGKILFTKEILSSTSGLTPVNIEIPTSGFSSGVYFVQIESAVFIESKKLIVVK